MLDFTGERVIPGLVDPDLLNEHLARYRFAARYAAGAKVLDAGCGTGYGAAEFAMASSVVGVDVSAEAVAHARGSFSRAGVCFLQGSCDALPFADGSFDLVAAFEVIEHIERWQELLREARRVLRPAGVLLVSTPNKAYYAEARGAAGPNPYHVREFEYEEFAAALHAGFSFVNLWTQNHSESIVFLSPVNAPGDFDAAADTAPESAHFFLAACSQAPLAEPRAFAWAPASGNILRERERHIALLEGEIEQKNRWLKRLEADQASLHASHEEVLAELKQRNEWAATLDAELRKSGETIRQLQAELEATHAGYQAAAKKLEAELEGTHAGYRAQVGRLEQELEDTHAGYRKQVEQLEGEATERLDWVHDLEAQIRQGTEQIERLEGELGDRTRWALALNAKLAQAASSKWVRLGRSLHLGPEIHGSDGQAE